MDTEIEFGSVLLKESAYNALNTEPHLLVQNVVDYVNFLYGPCNLTRDEIAEKLMQSYHVDFYSTQVNNGGHSQFIGNSRDAAQWTLPDVKNGLAAIGSSPHVAIYQGMLDWIRQNPKQAELQTGFAPHLSDYLDQLDKQFFKLENDTPLYQLNSQWIATWHDVVIVSDDSYPNRLQHMVTMVPNFTERQLSSKVRKLSARMDLDMELAFSMAAASAQPKELLINIGAGTQEKLDGKDVLAFLVRTDRGNRYIVEMNNSFAMFEYVEHSHISDFVNPDKSLRTDVEFSDYKPPEIGVCIGKISVSAVKQVAEIAANLNASHAVQLLLEEISVSDEVQVLVPTKIEKRLWKKSIEWFAVADGAYNIVTSDKGATIASLRNKDVKAQVSKNDIAAFATKLSKFGGLKAS